MTSPSFIFSPSTNTCEYKELAGIAKSSRLAYYAGCRTCMFPVGQSLVALIKGNIRKGVAFSIFPNTRANVQHSIIPNLKKIPQVMHQEKFTHHQLQDYAIKKRLSRFYIHLHMKRKSNRFYYGAECCTLQRIVFRKLQSIEFNGDRGLQQCKAIEQRHRGQYASATIYQRTTGTNWAPVIEYADGQAPVHHLQKPAPVVHMRVVHNALEGSITFINQQAA